MQRIFIFVVFVTGAELSSAGHAVITSGSGQFASHVVTLARDSVVVIDGARHHVDCEWQAVKSPSVVVPLASYK